MKLQETFFRFINHMPKYTHETINVFIGLHFSITKFIAGGHKSISIGRNMVKGCRKSKKLLRV